MYAKSVGQQKRKTKPPPEGNLGEENDPKQRELPPFIKHYKSSNVEGSVKYKIGDTEVWKEGTITKCQSFMNSALMKFNRITGDTESSFNGSSNLYPGR